MSNQLTRGEIFAKRVLFECGLDDPTDFAMSEIILGRKAFYQEIPFDSKDGEIVTVDNKSIISINSQIPYETRKRFAAAHELGHYEMHKSLSPILFDTEYDLISWYQGGVQEIEANDFAAELLMPSIIYRNECRGKIIGPTVIDDLANRFKVSKTAAILRYAKCGTHPVFVVCCKDRKMKWWKKSDDFNHFCEFESNVPPPSGSIAHEIFQSNDSQSKQDQVWKSTWFRMGSGEKDKQMYEYCLFVKSFNYTLSILWED